MFKTVLIKMVTILMMSTKTATLGPLKRKASWNKLRYVFLSMTPPTSFYHVTENTKFGNSSISMRRVIINSILQPE